MGLSQISSAHPVSLSTARAVASKFMETNDLRLETIYQTHQDEAAFYIFNTSKGFVIVSADDRETPIIAYSHEGCFDSNDVPPQLEAYLEDFAARIQYGIENHIEAEISTARQWEQVKAFGRLREGLSDRSVGPLLTEKWHQGCLYNSLCPTMEGPCDHAWVGCVAVAMGQVMHYWRYPTTGWGSYSYTNEGDTLSADFGETTYEWDLMPDSLTDHSSQEAIDAVATLLYHCGVAVNMHYTPSESTTGFQDAMTLYFNYSRHFRKESRSDYSEEEWISLLKESLDQQQPILYSGHGSAGHAFVCDGYDDNNLFHFNWGWGGSADGYYAMGNLNPNGHQFSSGNYAILDIVPQSEPCHVSATIVPANGGSIEGTGDYHYGAQCTLTAVPAEDYSFYAWRRQGQIISRDPSITIMVKDDISNIEALFTCLAISQITASEVDNDSVSGLSSVSLEWSSNTEWAFLKQFEINGEAGGVATDNEHIYISYTPWNYPPFMFEKYTMDGSLVESFNVDGLYGVFCLAFDGSYYYCNRLTYDPHFSDWQYVPLILYRVDLENKTVIDSTSFFYFSTLTYDSEFDGFWINYYPKVRLLNRQGLFIKGSPPFSDRLWSSAYYTAIDGTTHLLLLMESGIFDFDIHKNIIYDQPVLDIGVENYGACTGKYEGKDALFFVVGNTLQIYEINKSFGINAQIVHYRIYRTGDDGAPVMLADEITGTAYADTTWHTVPNGVYRFGISLVFADGSESEIIWSNAIEKTDYGVQEQTSDPEKRYQKVIENGHLYILVNGKKYSITGQEVR